MIKSLLIWLFGCWRDCEWETIRRVPVYDSRDGKRTSDIPFAFDYELRCKTCGEIKGKRL